MDISTLEIKDQINKYYREYALYVIESRGIPNFYDSLTPVQRLVMLNAPNSYQKTLGLVGDVIGSGLYHHGNASLENCIAKLARPFGNAEQILIGDGFFGTPVNPESSAPRYTAVKINPRIKDLINKNFSLNEKNAEGGFDWVHMETPTGLFSHIVGIAVGYRSNILPRKPSDIEAYLNGDTSKQLKPYFKDFNGKVSKSKEMMSGWIIEGEIEVNPKRKEILIKDLPPLLRFDNFMKRIYALLDNGWNFKVDNNSSDKVHVLLKYKENEQPFEDFQKLIERYTKILVSEDIVFVKDGCVVVYDDITHYLDEFKVHKELVILKRLIQEGQIIDDEIEFLKARLLFMKFMMEKKRKEDEIKKWMSPYNSEIRRRLDNVKLTYLMHENLKVTEDEIKEAESNFKAKKKEIDNQTKLYTKLEKGFKGQGKVSMKKAVSIINDPAVVNGIEVFKVEDTLTNNEETSEDNGE